MTTRPARPPKLSRCDIVLLLPFVLASDVPVIEVTPAQGDTQAMNDYTIQPDAKKGTLMLTLPDDKGVQAAITLTPERAMRMARALMLAVADLNPGDEAVRALEETRDMLNKVFADVDRPRPSLARNRK